MAEIIEGPEAIARGVAALRDGSLVAFPTETVYGLGADALNESAVARVFEAKNRPGSNPLIVHVSGAEMARTLTHEWTDDANQLAALWPGALTLVLPKSDAVPDAVTAGGPTVALRCPAHPIALALIEAFGGPIVGPSANLSGRVSPTRPEHAAAAFEHEDLVIIDGGACRSGIESTVVDLTTDPARVLRPGSIGIDQLARTLGRPVEPAAPDHDDSGARSPGRVGAHYRPSTALRVVETGELAGAGGRVAAVHWSGNPPQGAGGAIRLDAEIGGYACGLYAALHDADALGLDEIWIETPPGAANDPIRVAVMERLGRAGR